MPIRRPRSLLHARTRPVLAAFFGASLGCESTPATQSQSPQINSHAGPLSGVHIVVKDNIDVAGMPTTAGSLALRDNIAAADAPIIARLRDAGVVIDGKANLSEWANFRSTASTSGWSAVGGLTRNPHDLTRSACGSSSGSAAAVASGLVPMAIGTETDGSIVCPAAMCGVVGLKPTVGVLPGDGIVPISSRQDTAGPIAASVRLAALGLCAMAGSDQYLVTGDANALPGARLGVMRFHCDGYGEAVDAVFAQACAALREAGAELVDISTAPDLGRISQLEWSLLLEEFKDDINGYLATRPAAVSTRTLADLISFNESHRAEEMPYFGQEIFELSQATQGRASPDYAARAAEAARLAGPEGIDRLLRDHQCVALIAPTTGRAYPIRLEGGDQYEGACTTLPAVSGYPHLTVPMGMADGLPVGLSFIGTANADAMLMLLGASFEVARDHANGAAARPELTTFRDGARSWSYAVVEIEGWRVLLEESIAADSTLRHDIEAALADRLARVAKQVPPGALDYIRTIPIWASDEPTYPMREGERGVIPFHHSPEWLRDHGMNPSMAPGVHIINPRAVLYDHKVFEWGPETMLHELSHAYHFGRLGEDSAAVRAAFDHAMAEGLYQSIPSRRDPAIMVAAYATTNEKEYFAELTEAYFGHNDFFPHDRAELRGYDPVGCAMVAKAWGCPADDDAPPPLVWATGNTTWTTVPEWGLDAAHPIGSTHGGVIVDHHDHPHFNTDVDHGTLVFDSAGARLGAIAGEYAGIHGMQLRVEDGVEYLYAAHLRGKQIVKLRMDGTAVWTLGVPAESHKYDDDPNAYNPTAAAVAPDGRLFVADGYGRNWIHAYSADRGYLNSFGGRGAEPGQFQTCHGLGIDERGRAAASGSAADGSATREPLLVVCDRENRRLQRFTLEGELVDVPVTGLRRPCSIAFWDGPHGERLIAVAELEGRATILDGDYKVLGHVGTNDNPKQMAVNGVPPADWTPGITTAPHGIGFDADGNLYIEDWNATGRVHKFVRGRAPRQAP